MTIKFSVCADYHLHPQYPIPADGIKKIVARAEDENVDALLHCGDFIIDFQNNKDAFEVFFHNKAGIPAFGCYGNHELELTDCLETLNSIYGIKNSYFYRDVCGFRFVITDTNFFVKDGVFQRYPGFSVGGPDWSYDQNLLGETQLLWLEETLMSSPYPCLIVSHASFEEAPGCSEDASTVRKIIRKVNDRYPKKVLMCISGHDHTDSVKVIDGVVYFNVNAVYMGAWTLQKHRLFPRDFADRYESADNCAFYTDPLNAIVQVSSDGVIDIKGMETTYLYDVTPEKMGLDLKSPFGDLVPQITSTHIVL